jgi:hypothetical protein
MSCIVALSEYNCVRLTFLERVICWTQQCPTRPRDTDLTPRRVDWRGRPVQYPFHTGFDRIRFVIVVPFAALANFPPLIEPSAE